MRATAARARLTHPCAPSQLREELEEKERQFRDAKRQTIALGAEADAARGSLEAERGRVAEAESKAREGRDAAARMEARLRSEADELREQAAASARRVDALEGKLAAAERASAAAASKHAEQLRHRCGPPESRLGSRAARASR